MLELHGVVSFFMEPKDFDDLFDIADDIEQIKNDVDTDDLKEAESADHLVDEYGEIVDEELDDLTATLTSTELAHPGSNHKKNSLSDSWVKNSYLSPNETDKEFDLFSIFLTCGGGRTIQYISQISNLSYSTINKIAQKNKWQQRAADYDRNQLAIKLQQAQTARHDNHMKRLETYRQQQEALGHQLSLNAARIAFLANNKLSQMLDREDQIELRDLPSMLNTASKLAEVGKNLQSAALGVDQLLAAIEESEIN